MHDLIYFLNSSPMLFIACTGFIALLIGSFLNVVILRLPLALKQDWRKECYEYLELLVPSSEQKMLAEKINLLLPRSHCPNCKHTLRCIDNIPVVSYCFLGGVCHFCKEPIPLRYPLIELLTSGLCIIVACRFGVTWQTLAGCILTCVLIVQSGIDQDHKLIPDEVTIPCLWLGIVLSMFNLFADSHSAILGATSGYLSLWTIYWLFFLATKKEGMGYGDFKLLAMLGAWLGWKMLPFIVIFSSALGSIVGLLLLLFTNNTRNSLIPFGPFLAIAGWIALMWGPDINYWYLNYMGISQ